MVDSYDVVVVGAGPAGMSAAISAAEHGLSVVVCDENDEPGGQIFRGLEWMHSTNPQRAAALGESYTRGLDLLHRFRGAAVAFLVNTTVWQIDGSDVYTSSKNGQSTVLRGRQIIIATGAVERPTPFPGWTLPGVMSCGGAQILLKTSGVVPTGRTVLAGTGPLLFMLAWQLLKMGVQIDGILETTSHRNYAKTLVRSFGAMRNPKYLRLGFSILGDLRGANIPIVGDVTELQAHGDARVAEVSYRHNKQTARELVSNLFIHQGIVPNLNLWLSLRADYTWNAIQRSFQPRRDAWGALSVPASFAIGDCARLDGADSAAIEGRLAGLAIAAKLERLSESERDRLARPQWRALSHERRARAFLDRLYQPARAMLAPRDSATVICRCENVRVGELRDAIKLGCSGPNQLKAFTRCGMGPCQGRLCGHAVVETIADACGVTPERVGYYRVRPPIKPITIGEIARSSVGVGAVGRP